MTHGGILTLLSGQRGACKCRMRQPQAVRQCDRECACAGLRIKENKEVYEGEVTELTPEETLNPGGRLRQSHLARRHRPAHCQGHQAAQAGPHHLRQARWPAVTQQDCNVVCRWLRHVFEQVSLLFRCQRAELTALVL